MYTRFISTKATICLVLSISQIESDSLYYYNSWRTLLREPITAVVNKHDQRVISRAIVMLLVYKDYNDEMCKKC